jgi:hypothetical protein
LVTASSVFVVRLGLDEAEPRDRVRVRRSGELGHGAQVQRRQHERRNMEAS